MFRRIDETIFVSPQVTPGDIADAASMGVLHVINNRPDGEDESQPDGDSIKAAALAAGLTYIAIPVTHAGFGYGQVEAMVRALEEADGAVLAYCRSGTRSTFLWALARAKMGENPAVLTEKAEAVGYDLRPIRPMLDALSTA